MGVAVPNMMRGRALGRGVLVGGGALALISGGLFLGHAWKMQSPAAITPEQAKSTPPPPWTATELTDLLGAVDASAAEGLRPSDYDRPELANAVRDGRTGAAVDLVATHAALSLAHDYAAGRITHRNRFNWYIDNGGPDDAALTDQLRSARAEGRLVPWLQGLLPAEPSYVALRTALAAAPATDEAHRDKIRVNMERWRWLPRNFGTGDQIYVNLPSYELEMRRGGQPAIRYNVVIGATGMPTPTLSSMATQVIANPTWILPQSIIEKSKLRPGSSSRYTFTRLPSGRLRVSQKPGAGNALGKVKIEFPNKLAIYLHDTPSRWLFGATTRAFSHGCVRVQHVDELASRLLDQDPRFTAALQDDKTRGFKVSHPWRVNIVYFTMTAEPQQSPVELGDPYKLDDAMAAALDGRSVKWPEVAAAAIPVPAPSRKIHRPAVASVRKPAPETESVMPDEPALPAFANSTAAE